MAGNGIAVTISAVDRASKTLDGIDRKITLANAPVVRLQKSFDRLASNTGVRDVGRFMGDLAKSSERVFANVSRAVPGMAALGGALSLAGLAEGMRRSAEYGTHLQLTARRAGVGVGSLQRLGNAAEISGGSFQGATESLADLNKNMQLLAHGGQADAQFTAAAAALHINLRDTNGQMRSSASVMDEALHKLAQMKDAQKQLYFGNALLGSSFQTALFPAVQGGTKALDDYLKAGAQVVSLTPQQTQVLREAQVQTRRLGTDVVGLANQIMADLAPAEIKAAGGMSEWIEKNQQWVASDIAGHIRDVSAAVKGVVDGVGGWQNAAGDLLEFWSAKFAPGILGPLLRADALIRAIEQYGEKHAIPGTHTAANAARGAAAGAAFGSVVPGVGTVAGAVAGGVGGALWDMNPLGLNDVTPYQAWRYLSGPGAAPGGAIPRLPSRADRIRTMQEITRQLRSYGWTREQTAGILSGLSAESGFNPGAIGDNGTSFGLAQWHADRLQLFSQWLRQTTNGRVTDPRQSTVAQQVAFLNWELTRGDKKDVGERLRRETSARGASFAFNRGFEIPANPDQTSAMRANNADQFMPVAGDSVVKMHRSAPGSLDQQIGAALAPHIELAMPQRQEQATTVKGAATLDIRIHGAPPGSHAAANTSGDLWAGAPRVVMPLPGGGGPPT